MNSIVEFKFPIFVFSAFFLLANSGILVGADEKTADSKKSEGTAVVKKDENKNKSKSVKSKVTAKSKSQSQSQKSKSVKTKRVVASAKGKSLRGAKNVRALGKFDRKGNIKSYKQAVEKLVAYIEKDFARPGISLKIRKNEELDLFRCLVSIGTVAGYDNFDTAEHFDAALKLLGVALDSKSKTKFRSKSIIKRLEKLEKRIEDEKKDPKKIEERKKKAAQIRSGKKSKGKLKIKSKGMKKSLGTSKSGKSTKVKKEKVEKKETVKADESKEAKSSDVEKIKESQSQDKDDKEVKAKKEKVKADKSKKSKAKGMQQSRGKELKAAKKAKETKSKSKKTAKIETKEEEPKQTTGQQNQ